MEQTLSFEKKYTDIYLVDCENVKYYRNFNPNHFIVYFKNAEYQLPFEDLHDNEREVFVNTRDKYGKIIKDAMDFCMDSRLGFLLAYCGNKFRYHIVSRDKGFQIMKLYWGSSYQIIIDNLYV